MPGYKDLARLVREGKNGHEIVEELNLPPSKLRRLMASPRLHEELRTEGLLSGYVAAQNVALGIKDSLERLQELANSDNAETSRKACLALIAEALRITSPQQGPRPINHELLKENARLGSG